MKIIGIGDWIAAKLAALKGGKEQQPAPKPQSHRHNRFMQPIWQRNVHPSASAIQKGRTLDPYAVARATKQLTQNKKKEATNAR